MQENTLGSCKECELGISVSKDLNVGLTWHISAHDLVPDVASFGAEKGR